MGRFSAHAVYTNPERVKCTSPGLAKLPWVNLTNQTFALKGLYKISPARRFRNFTFTTLPALILHPITNVLGLDNKSVSKPLRQFFMFNLL